MNKLTAVICGIICLLSCKIQYSMGNPGSIPSEASTFTVETFENRASLAPPGLSQTISEGLKDIILSQSKLQTQSEGGDLLFSGEITNYSNTITGLQNNDQAAQNILTITVNVTYVNPFDESKNFTKAFSGKEVYDASATLTEVEESLIESIKEQIAQAVFEAAFGDW